MPRRCRPRSVTGLRVCLALGYLLGRIVALVALRCRTPSGAQSTPAADRYAKRRRPTRTPICCSRRLRAIRQSAELCAAGKSDGAAPDQAPPTGKFTAPASRIGATPVYGSPTGFGAGDTGFNSSNAPHKRSAQVPDQGTASRRRPRPPSTRTGAAAASVVGAAGAAAATGAASSIRPRPRRGRARSCRRRPINCRSAIRRRWCIRVRRRPGPALSCRFHRPEDFQGSASDAAARNAAAEHVCRLERCRTARCRSPRGDPYEALGIEAGSFLILPAVELSAGYNTNPQAAPGGPGSPISSSRRNCMRVPIGRAIRSPPISPAPIRTTQATASSRR